MRIPIHPKVIKAIPVEPKQTEFKLVVPRAEPEQPAATQPNPIRVSLAHPGAPSLNTPGQGVPGPAARAAVSEDEGQLLDGIDELRANWQRVKAGFVDNPNGAVAE